jgi:hypothetical protein
MALWGSETLWGQWRRGLGDGTYVVDDITNLGRGRWWCVRRVRPGLGTMARRLQGGINEGAGSREISARNFGNLTT